LSTAQGIDGGIHFVVPTADMGLKQSVQPVRDHELFALYGFPPDFAKTVVNLPWREKDLLLLWSMPKQSIKRVISVLQMAEMQAADDRMATLAKEAGETPVKDLSVVPSFYCSPRNEDEAPFCFATSQVINQWTTIPCPTMDEWKDESSKDPDVAYLIERISAKKTVALAKLSEKEYYQVWAKNQLEVEDGILYQWEYPKVARVRQLRRRVVPIGSHQAVYTAYHATPLAGHVGFYKTYWRIAAQYYWPSMYSDVKKAVIECGHCILGNNTSHHAQQILGSLSMDDEPFDIIAIDIYLDSWCYQVEERFRRRQSNDLTSCVDQPFQLDGICHGGIPRQFGGGKGD
jgi:Integrase zinc binding domain